MAETLISPGVLARENDQSQITSQPVQAGAAIVGPTVKGQPNIPKLVTSYSEYLANFGSTFTSGSDTYTFLTSISAFNYFQNGGESLLVTRVVSGSFSPAVSTEIYNGVESGKVNIINMTGSLGPANTTNADGAIGQVFNAAPQDLVAATYGSVTPTYTAVSGETPTIPTFAVVVTGTGSLNSIVPATSGSDFAVGGVLTFAGTDLGGGGSLLVNSPTVPTTNTNVGDGTAVGTIDNITTVDSVGTGTGAIVTATVAYTGKLVASTTITSFDSNSSTGYNNSVAGTSATHTINSGDVFGNGEGGIITVDCDSSGVVTSITITAQDASNSYDASSQILLSEADLNTMFAGTAGTGTVTCSPFGAASPNLESSIASFVVKNTNTLGGGGSGYDATSLLTFDNTILGTGGLSGGSSTYQVVSGDLVAATDVTITLSAGQINNQSAFQLETLSEGSMMNSIGPETSTGALASGSANNFRWEITNPSTDQGVFSVIIRQGNDKSKDKSVVETFPNVSLDPKASNYIERVIGNQQISVQGGSDPYLQTLGSYPNGSRYVRVSAVNAKTPDYFDNDGNPKPEYATSLPLAGSGSFKDATGEIVDNVGSDNYYNNINNTDTQGVSGSNYITAFNILANKDDFKYNLITAPGLVYAGSTQASPLNTLISNTEQRGDAIVVVDLEYYGATITMATSTAATIDSSYVAAYWPWVQITDPDSRQLVWVPASTMIPGVYAYNDKAGEAWFAPAGINRGGLGTVRQAERKLTQANRDSLYTGKVNPIATFPGRGVVVFGQKTLQTKASALDRVNVRRLLIELKSYISQIADNLVFEQNTQATRNNFLAQVNPYLENVQQRQGLYAFKVVMDDSNNTPDVIDRNQLIGAIYLQPTKTAEFIYLDFNILPTGATFPA